MRRRTILMILGLALVGAGWFVQSYGALNILTKVVGPHHGWDEGRKAPPLDYGLAASWAALPGREGPAGFVPAGEAGRDTPPSVDVFFIHPTTYMKGEDWNAPLTPRSVTRENIDWTLANQASAFNGCCDIYAPHYREASIFTYLGASPEVAEKTMALAFSDVDRAFLHYLKHYNNGRPFIIAAHSQGAVHAMELVRRRIDGQAISGRLVAVYAVGGRIFEGDVAKLKTIGVCDGPEQTGCIIGWNTYGVGGKPRFAQPTPLVCVNPLTWRRGGERAPATRHLGGVPPSGVFNIRMWGRDEATGRPPPPLAEPVRHATWAECRDGQLFVADQEGGPMDIEMAMGPKIYHMLDYPLFQMDIRANVETRIDAFRAKQAGEARLPAER